MTNVVATRDWRGAAIHVGDMVVFPYAWGGVATAMCEGEIVEIEDDTVRIDLHYDNGLYPRKRDWIVVPCERVTKVPARAFGCGVAVAPV